MALAVLREKKARGIEVRVIANASEHVENFATIRARITDAIRRD